MVKLPNLVVIINWKKFETAVLVDIIFIYSVSPETTNKQKTNKGAIWLDLQQHQQEEHVNKQLTLVLWLYHVQSFFVTAGLPASNKQPLICYSVEGKQSQKGMIISSSMIPKHGK